MIVWEAHTEYYSYQVWHIAGDATMPLTFGSLMYPGYFFPFSPLGIKVNALDLLVLPQAVPTQESLHASLPGPHVYGSRLFGEDIVAATSFTPDEYQRERYLICRHPLKYCVITLRRSSIRLSPSKIITTW